MELGEARDKGSRELSHVSVAELREDRNYLSQTMEENSVSQDAGTQNAKVYSCCFRCDFGDSRDRSSLRILYVLGCGHAAESEQPYPEKPIDVVVPLVSVQYEMCKESEESKHRWAVCDLDRVDELRHGVVPIFRAQLPSK